MDSLMTHCIRWTELLLIITSGIVAELLERPYDLDSLAPHNDDPDGHLGVTTAAGPGGGGGGGGTRGGQEALRAWMMQSIKKKILEETGRGGGGGSHVTGNVRQTTGETIGQVREVIAFADTPVSMTTDNGTLEFTLRPNRTSDSRHHLHFRVDNAAMFVRVNARRPNNRQQHVRHQRRAATISVIQLNGAREPAHSAAGGLEPLPIATASIRVRSVGWQEVPLPSSVVQDVLDSADPVLRVSLVCENCEVLPSTSPHPAVTSHPVVAAATGSGRRGSGDGHGAARRRHGNDLPYLTITTTSAVEK